MAGGVLNSASHNYATVVGGMANAATFNYSTVNGGGYNLAAQAYATVRLRSAPRHLVQREEGGIDPNQSLQREPFLLALPRQ